MCIGCADFVDYCAEGECNRTVPGGRYRHTTFYLDSLTFCEHLTAEHGTSSPSHYAHFKRWHDDENCECVAGNWWGDKPRPNIPEEDDA